MPRKPHDFASAVDITAEQLYEFSARAVGATVQGDTLEAYRSKVIQLENLAEAVNGKDAPITRDVFIRFAFSWIEAGRCPSSLRTYRSAWAYFAKLAEQPLDDITTEFLDRMIEGLVYNAGMPTERKPRGALCSSKLRQLVSVAPPHLRDGLVLAWLALLRRSEAQNLTVDDVRLDGPVAMVWIRSDKRARAGSRRPEGHLRPCEAARALLTRLVEGRAGSEKLLIGWRYTQVLHSIKEAARLFEWSTSVNWDGPHTLRHGRAAELEATDATTTEWLRLGSWSSSSTLQRYRGAQRKGLAQ